MTQLRPMKIEDISFGVVERAITIGSERRLRGSEISYGELARMPASNRNALIENRFIAVYPKGVTVRREGGQVIAPERIEISEAGGQLHVIAKGFGKWDVIQGTIVGTGLTKEAAQLLAGQVGPHAAPVNQDAPASAAAPARKKRRASPGKRLPPKPPGEPQDNGPIQG